MSEEDNFDFSDGFSDKDWVGNEEDDLWDDEDFGKEDFSPEDE